MFVGSRASGRVARPRLGETVQHCLCAISQRRKPCRRFILVRMSMTCGREGSRSAFDRETRNCWPSGGCRFGSPNQRVMCATEGTHRRAYAAVMEILDPTSGIRPLCGHGPVERATPRASSCEECGSRFNLRGCTHCGHVGCCESQAGHARAHALTEDHPVIEQMTGSGPGFAWCYAERKYVG